MSDTSARPAPAGSISPTRPASWRWPTGSCRGWRRYRRGPAGCRPLPGLHRAGGFPAGHHRAHHVHPRAVRLARHDVLLADGGLGARHAGLAPPAGRCRAARPPRRSAPPSPRLRWSPARIWGKPMWGTWWVWDARLTSVFVLFLMYLGIIALTRALDDPARAARAGRDHHAGRLHQHPDHQVLGRLVEHAAPAGVGVPPRRPDDRPEHAVAAAGDGARLHRCCSSRCI